MNVGPRGGEATHIVGKGTHTVWVDGEPSGGPEALAEALIRGDASMAGAWAAVVVGPDGLRAHTAPFGGCALYTDGLSVASDLAAFAPKSRPIDVEGVRQHLVADPRDRTSTFVFGVRRIPEAHAVRLDGSLAFVRAWQPTPVCVPEPAPAVRAGVMRALEALPAGDPGAVALSGGLDSSVLALALARVRPVRCVSNRFPGEAADEGRWLEAVCAAGSLPRIDVDSRALDPFAVLDLLRPPELPPLISNHHLNLALLRVCGGALITGFGGDEVIGHGLGVTREMFAAGRPARALWEAGWLAARFRHGRERAQIPRWIRHLRNALVAPAADPLLQRRADLQHPWIGRSRDEIGRVARAAGGVVRTPLLDPGLADVMMGVPTHARVRRGRTRWVMRQAFADLLPELVLRRTDKADLSLALLRPVQRRLPELRSELDRAPLDRWVPRATRAGWCDAVERGDSSSAAAVWRAIGASRWLAWHADRDSFQRGPPGAATPGRA